MWQTVAWGSWTIVPIHVSHPTRGRRARIEHRAKRHTVFLRDLRAVSLLLRVEKLACLIANVARCRTIGLVPAVHRWCQSKVRRICLVAANRPRYVHRIGSKWQR
jgi:hypothetical protein